MIEAQEEIFNVKLYTNSIIKRANNNKKSFGIAKTGKSYKRGKYYGRQQIEEVIGLKK